MTTKKILIVEDDKMLCTIFKMFTKELGYDLVGISQTGKDSISLCKDKKPEVVLMDIHLQGEMNGIEAAKIIGKEFNLPVIYISSDIESDTIDKAIQQNTYGFLVKPIYKATLGAAIEFAIKKHNYDLQ